LRPLRIATRKSPLALWQARHVADLVQRLAPGTEVSWVEMTTEGDRFLAAPLSRIGGKGLFVKEIEQALLDGRADVAVHSLKDMTSELTPRLCLAAVPVREDPRDTLVGPSGATLSGIPRGATLGTSSLRRSCQIRERRPDVKIEMLRGNVQTRLRKMSEAGMAGAILALAGLRRLGLEAQVTEVLEPEVSLPAVGQGALAIECRDDDAELRELLARLEDPITRIAVTAERGFLARMAGGCTVPLAGYATVDTGRVRLRGLVGRPDGTRVVRAERTGPAAEAERLGRDLGEELWTKGGEEILRELGS
jgi:hydroxymethylbilane synthase